MKPLHMICASWLENGVFPSLWKMTNFVPIHKKSKQLVKNYRPALLLPICGKIFERLIYNELYSYLIDDNLTSLNQCFKQGHSWINQLQPITHEIYNSFDERFKVLGVFLDISKALDKVWHEGLLSKLRKNVISGNLLLVLQLVPTLLNVSLEGLLKKQLHSSIYLLTLSFIL